jgi:hypothetical protein
MDLVMVDMEALLETLVRVLGFIFFSSIICI